MEGKGDSPEVAANRDLSSCDIRDEVCFMCAEPNHRLKPSHRYFIATVLSSVFK